MAFGDSGVIEVFGGIAGHAELFHDATGAEIGRDGEGDNFVEREGGEGVMQESLCALCGVAAAPGGPAQPVAELDVSAVGAAGAGAKVKPAEKLPGGGKPRGKKGKGDIFHAQATEQRLIKSRFAIRKKKLARLYLLASIANVTCLSGDQS